MFLNSKLHRRWFINQSKPHEHASSLRALPPHHKGPAPRSSPFARFYKPAFSRDPWIGLLKQQQQQQQQHARGIESKEGNSLANAKPKAYGDWYAEEMMCVVRQQAEFYLSPQNLNTDKFLQKALKQGQGWVPLTLICQFPRMAEKHAEPGTLLRALQNSALVEISANQQLLRPRGRRENKDLKGL
uniref:HTH La-type RNA-binding domain-containing protein n=1 Tax=Dunaliella tertiolecta TaxID=3047 RepID=A0A7S3R418_DUNTE